MSYFNIVIVKIIVIYDGIPRSWLSNSLKFSKKKHLKIDDE